MLGKLVPTMFWVVYKMICQGCVYSLLDCSVKSKGDFIRLELPQTHYLTMHRNRQKGGKLVHLMSTF